MNSPALKCFRYSFSEKFRNYTSYKVISLDLSRHVILSIVNNNSQRTKVFGQIEYFLATNVTNNEEISLGTGKVKEFCVQQTFLRKTTKSSFKIDFFIAVTSLCALLWLIPPTLKFSKKVTVLVMSAGRGRMRKFVIFLESFRSG